MKNNQVFVAHHCENSSTRIELSLIEKEYIITKKDCSGIKALRYILREKPELCILRSSYKDLSGLEIVKEAIRKKSNSKFIIVFNEVNEIDLAMAAKLNISGCVSCKDSISEVLNCLDKVHNNGHYFSKVIYQKLDKERLKSYTSFTDFQMKIIAYIGFYNNPERLARKLNAAISTVNNEIELIKSQLSLTGDQHLHLWAVKNTRFVESLVLKSA